MLEKNKKTPKFFLGLMKRKTGSLEITHDIKAVTNLTKLHFMYFKKIYSKVLNVVILFDSIITYVGSHNSNIFGIISYYTNQANRNQTCTQLGNKNYTMFKQFNHNVIVFSQPKKQLFVVFFKDAPAFIFTNGLMKFIINEKKKCSKKMHKVFISLIKLSTVLLHKKIYFDSCSLRFNNLGDIKYNVLKSFKRASELNKIQYVFIKLRFDQTAQTLGTRRSIKKYVKKRFNIR